MRPNLSVKLGLLTVVVATSAFVASPAIRDGESRSAVASAEEWQQSEVARVQEHLAGAERLLLDAGVASLSPLQRGARARNIQLLREYREHGVFPRNIDFAGRHEPYFVDDRGVLCAMAYLIAASGRKDIVERVRSSRNNARIRELADDPALVAWLDESGLSLAEAGRIQPTYGYSPPDMVTERAPVSTQYAVASVGLGLTNLLTIVLNAPRDGASLASPWIGALGALGGAAGLAVGAPRIQDGGAATVFGSLNMAVGTFAVMAGARNLYLNSRARRAGAQPRSTASGSTPRVAAKGAARVSLAPTVGSGTGMLLNLTF